MWVLSERPILGVFAFFRKNSLQIAAVLAAFLCTVLFSNAAFAVSAEWENGSITYDDRTFSGPQTAPEDSPLGLPEGTQYFEHRDGNNVSVVYFPEGADPSDASGARYATFTQNGDNYTPSGSEQSIAVTPQSEGEGSEDGEVTSCAVNGIGYILCPIMGFIADGMDRIYDFLQNFLEVRPLSTETDSSLFQAWRYMQSFANIAFVLVFLVVVYSQITSQGISNYNVKRMIPRMVIAALFVNTSYYICALLVDASNIIGASLQEIMMQIREELIQGQEQNRLDSLSWGEMTAYLLSGGTVVGASLVGLSVSGTGLVYLLVPILVSALFAVFVAVAILAARQALITILIMIAPLAFVAFVLPGTQKYFDKWRSIFQTMLLLYPIFSLLFGGAQLAAYLISQNADRPEVILLAMFVAIAPLIITPFLIRFSGGMLGKLAGMMNNPMKGPLDKTKNWANSKHDKAKAERLAGSHWSAGIARGLDASRRRDEALKKRYESRRNRRFNSGVMGRNLVVEQMQEDERNRGVDATNETAFEDLRRTDESMRFESVKVKLAEMNRDTAKKEMEVRLDELATKQGGAAESSAAIADMSQRMQLVSQRQQILGSRAAMAAQANRGAYSDAMINNKDIQRAAGGVLGAQGEMIAAASAVVEARQDFGKSAGAVKEVMQHIRMSGGDVAKLALREEVVTEGGFRFDFKDEHVLEAAVDKLLTEKGNVEQKIKLVGRTSEDEYAGVRTTVEGLVAKNLTSAAPWLGGKALDSIGTTGVSAADFGDMVRDYVYKGKVNQSALANADQEALKIMIEAVESDTSYKYMSKDKQQKYSDNRIKLFESATAALSNKQLQESIRDNAREHLKKLSDKDPNAQMGGRTP